MGDDEFEDLRLVLSSSDNDDVAENDSQKMYISPSKDLKLRAILPIQSSNKMSNPTTSRDVGMVSAQNVTFRSATKFEEVVYCSSNTNIIQTTELSNIEVNTKIPADSYPKDAIVSPPNAMETVKSTGLVETISVPEVDGIKELQINDVEEGKPSGVRGMVEGPFTRIIAGPQARSRLSGLLKDLKVRVNNPNNGKLDTRDECGPKVTDNGDGEVEVVHSEEKKKFTCNKLTLKKKNKAFRNNPNRNVTTLEGEDPEKISEGGTVTEFYFAKCDNKQDETYDESNRECERDIKPDPLALLIKPCSVNVENYFGDFEKSLARTVFHSLGLDAVIGKEKVPKLRTEGSEGKMGIPSWQDPGSTNDMGIKQSNKRACSNKLTRRGKFKKNSCSTDTAVNKIRKCYVRLSKTRRTRDSSAAPLTTTICSDVEKAAKESSISASSKEELCGNVGIRSCIGNENELSLRRSRRRSTQISTKATASLLRTCTIKTKAVGNNPVQPHGSIQCYSKEGSSESVELKEVSAAGKSPSLSYVPEVSDDISAELQKMCGNEEYSQPVIDMNEDMTLRMIFNTTSVEPGSITEKMKCVSNCEGNQTKGNVENETEESALDELCLEEKLHSPNYDLAKTLDFVTSANRSTGMANVDCCNPCTMNVNESSKPEKLVSLEPVDTNLSTIKENEFNESFEKLKLSCEDSLCEDDFSFEEFDKNDINDAVQSDEKNENEFFQEPENMKPVEGVVACTNDDAIGDKEEFVTTDSYGGSKNSTETLDAPITATRALPVSRCIVEKIEVANEMVTTSPYSGIATTGGLGCKDNYSSRQSSAKDKSSSNITDSLASDTVEVKDSQSYSRNLNESEIEMSSMPYPNSRKSSLNSHSPLRVSAMFEPPSYLVQTLIAKENLPFSHNAPFQSHYSPIVDEHQKEAPTVKDNLPGTTHLPVLSDLSKCINQEPVVKDVLTDFEQVPDKNDLISPFHSVDQFSTTVFSSSRVSTPVLEVSPTAFKLQVLKDNVASTQESMSEVINSVDEDEFGDLTCPSIENILTDVGTFHGESELLKVTDPGFIGNSNDGLPDLGQNKLFEDENFNLSGVSEEDSNLKQKLQVGFYDLNLSIESDMETPNNRLPDFGQMRLFDNEDLNLSDVSEEDSKLKQNVQMVLDDLNLSVESDTEISNNGLPDSGHKRLFEDEDMFREDDLQMVRGDLNLSTESGESLTLKQDIAQCVVSRSEHQFMSVELPHSVGNIRDTGELDLPSGSKENVEIEHANQLNHSAVEVNALDIDKEVSPRDSIGSVQSSKLVTAPENMKSDEYKTKINIVNRDLPCLSIVERLAKDIVSNIIPASDTSTSPSPSLVPSKISLQSPSITSSTEPIIAPVPLFPMQEGNLDNVSTSDSSDDDTGVVILEETVVDTTYTPVVSVQYSNEVKDDAAPDKICRKRDKFTAEPRPCLVSGDVNFRQEMSEVKKRKLSRNLSLKGRELEPKNESLGSSATNNVHKLSRESNESENYVAGRNSTALSKRFKIPKGPAKFPGYDAYSKEMVVFEGERLSVRRFMKEEGIIPNCDSFLNDDNWKKVEAMFDRVENISSYQECDREPHVVDDLSEVSDLEGQNNQMKNLKNDLDRKRHSKKMFQNVVSSDPGNNLSYHGFRRTMKERAEKPKNLDVKAFHISGGRVKTLLGYKCIGKIVKPVRKDVFKTDKEINLKGHGLVMKKLFVHKFIKKFAVKKTLPDTQEDFLTYLKHYKTGQEETSNFLAFYNSKKVLKLDQVKEVVDLESQFSTFLTYYGEAEKFFCNDCKKKHKFCQ